MTRRITALIPAAGRGRRFGGGKLRAPVGGQALIRHVVACYATHPAFDPVIIVTGADGAALRRALKGLKCRCISAPAPGAGMAASLKAGARAAPPDQAVAIQPADMPLINHALLDEMLRRHRPHRIVRPVHEGVPGHPVIWPARALPRLRQMTGENGARRLLTRWSALLDRAPWDETAIFDVDRPGDLARLKANRGHAWGQYSSGRG
ncbi:nucleotidyltransferase family protein [Yunchengibacter salinarum]|uniref:nucleotidyltransferase family protein n=1 Tax=Yunchengibacter salinarum TaxID=3133399 RepID=UPI0035B57FB6